MSLPSYTDLNVAEATTFMQTSPIGRLYSDTFQEDDFIFGVDGKTYFFSPKERTIEEWDFVNDVEEITSDELLETMTFYWLNGNEDWMETTLLQELQDAVKASATSLLELKGSEKIVLHCK